MEKSAVDSWYSWLILLCAFIYNGIEVGVYESAAVYMIDWVTKYHATWSQVGMISSLMNGIAYMAAVFIGPLVDTFGCRLVSYMGTTIVLAGLISSAMAPSIRWLYVTYGVLIGCGDAIWADPPLFSVHFYFKKRRPFAAGFCRVGHSLGEFTMLPLLRLILDYYGLLGAMLLHAGLVMQCYILGSSFRPIDLSELDDNCKKSAIVVNDVSLNEFTCSLKEKEYSNDTCTTKVHVSLDEDNVFSSGVKDQNFKDKTETLEQAHKSSVITKNKFSNKNINSNIVVDNNESQEFQNLIEKAITTECGINLVNSLKNEVKSTHCSSNLFHKSNAKKCSLNPYKLLTATWDFTLFKNLYFVEFIAGIAICQYSLAVGTKFTPLKAMHDGLSSMDATLLLTVSAFSALVSRCVSSIVGNLAFVNRTYLCGAAFLFQGIVVILCCFAFDFYSYCAVMVCFGVTVGAHYTLGSIVLVDLVGASHIAQASSFLYFFIGLAILTALPIAGLIIDTTNNIDIPYFVFGGLNFIGAALILVIPIQQKRTNKKDCAKDIT